MPAFIKVDVEGFEAEVLSGLTTPVKAVSVEFATEGLKNTLRCIDHMEALARYKYQFSSEETMQWALPSWVSASEMKDFLGKVDPRSFGDVYLRQVSTGPERDDNPQ